MSEGPAPSAASGVDPFLASYSFWRWLATLGVPALSSLCLYCHVAFSLCLCLHMAAFSSRKDTSQIELRDGPDDLLITSPNKDTFMGPGG